MQNQLGRALLESFLDVSRPSVDALSRALRAQSVADRGVVQLFRFHEGHRENLGIPSERFLVRTSVEYANPQLTLEELQGIVLARLLEVAAAYLSERSREPLGPSDFEAMAQLLAEPPQGPVLPFLMNVDDVEADRYSINPLRGSLVKTAQTAKAAANVVIDGLEVDRAFVDKYRGSLIGDRDVREIEEYLGSASNSSYADFVDSVKYGQLDRLSAELGLQLSIPALRMPITTLRAETRTGRVHRLVSAAHSDLRMLRKVYSLFGRDFARRKTLLPAVPHSPGGAASKRLVRGHIQVNETSIERIEARYGSGPLYPNEIDRGDVAQAYADEFFEVPPSKFREYDFRETPASPQFALYMVASPENGAIWHGAGKYAGMQIVESYTAFHRETGPARSLFGIPMDCPPEPIQFDLVASEMLSHPAHGNIDASVNCVLDVSRILPRATNLRLLVVPPFGSRTGTTDHSQSSTPAPSPMDAACGLASTRPRPTVVGEARIPASGRPRDPPRT